MTCYNACTQYFDSFFVAMSVIKINYYNLVFIGSAFAKVGFVCIKQ